MKSVIVQYEKISPSILESLIHCVCGNALCMWKDLDEDCFEFEVMGWLPLTARDLVKIEEVLADYV